MKADGGSAFPKYFGGNRDLAAGEVPGMSLRDWFAGQVISAIASADLGSQFSKSVAYRYAAEQAYLIADAMLVEREK